jgi:imidazolonepropionase-like amidohydrolase
MYEEARGIFATEQKLVGMMYRAGVPLLAGTDAMNPYCFPGFGLHDELGLLVASGLTPLAALQAATIRPADFMGRTADMGSVERGKVADMVLLDVDPLKDIHNTTKIRAVWRAGRYLDRPELDQLLDQARRNARK